MLERSEGPRPGRFIGHAGSDGYALPGPYSGEPYGFQDLREETEAPFDPLKLLWYVVQYRWLIAVLCVLGLVLGGVITFMQSPKYQATARIEIMVPTARVLEDLDVVAQTSDMRTFETARERLKSRDLARRVVLQLGLAQNVDFLFPAPDFAIGNIFSRVFGTSPRASLDDYDAEVRESIAVGRLLNDLSVALVRGTSLLAVSFSSTSPQLASDVANQVVRSYMDQQVDRTMETSELARQFIEEQVAEVKTRLEQSETALVAYAKDAGISSAGQGSLVSANIEAINSALSTAIQTRLADERLVAQIDAGDGARLQQVLDSEAIQSLRGRIAELRGEYQQKLGTFKPEFPEMQRLSAQIGELERQVAEGVATISASLKLKLQESTRAEQDLRVKLAELEAEQVEFQDKNIQYTILNREVESNRAQYQSLIDKLNDLGVVSELRRANVEVVDLAQTPGAPFSPSLSRNLLMFLAAGIALAAAVIYVLELLNNKFNAPDQVESELKLPVLGIIPQAEAGALAETLADPRSSLSEAYRSLRTSLQFAGSEGAPRTLLLTSSEPGEAKSTSAFKLAEEFAAIGVKVLIVDADLRRPSLHRLFKTDNTTGLTNLLTSTIAPDAVRTLFRGTANERVTFLSSGPLVPNPADLLSSHRMGSILSACMQTYDMIIIDGPPVIGLSDALILSRLAEATMLVVSAHQVQRKSAKAALKRLRSAGGHMVGATLAKLDVKRVEYSYAYRYMYEGYYSYGGDQKLIAETKGEQGERNDQVSKTNRGLQHFVDRYIRPRPQRG